MNRHPLRSSTLRSLAYDARRFVLAVEFHDGAVDEYGRVPQQVVDSLLAAASPDAYLAEHVRGTYPVHRRQGPMNFRES